MLLPEAYRRAAQRRQLAPDHCLMVACHPFDLDAAAKVGFRTALVRRPKEWGAQVAESPQMPPSGTFDLEVDNIAELLTQL
mgnify:CR=1 FL=1